MFDIGFWELLLIGVVALVVVGPDKLPRMARTAGVWLGRIQRMTTDLKAEVKRELAIDEARALRESLEIPEIAEFKEETSKVLQDVVQSKHGKQAPSKRGAPALRDKQYED